MIGAYEKSLGAKQGLKLTQRPVELAIHLCRQYVLQCTSLRPPFAGLHHRLQKPASLGALPNGVLHGRFRLQVPKILVTGALRARRSHKNVAPAGSEQLLGTFS